MRNGKAFPFRWNKTVTAREESAGGIRRRVLRSGEFDSILFRAKIKRLRSAALERIAILSEDGVGDTLAERDRVDGRVLGEAAKRGELRH